MGSRCLLLRSQVSYLSHLMDLTFCDLQVFGLLKDVIQGKSFKFGEEVKRDCASGYTYSQKKFYRGIYALIMWNTCISHHGYYVQKII